VRSIEPELRQMLGPTIELRVQLAAPEANVELDLGGPEELLLNLTSNARDAMPQGGQLAIETRVIRRSFEPQASKGPRLWALLRVSDTGHGMNAQTRARAFQPFFTTKGNGRGSGLGLAMVLGMVQRGCGHIEVDSEPGNGTAFSVYLPLDEQ
jgi:signal transduction histidine kinase